MNEATIPPQKVKCCAPCMHIHCKNCGEPDDLIIKNTFLAGYFIKCNNCTMRTLMNYKCPQCGSKKAKVEKKADEYQLNCPSCKTVLAIHYG